MKTYKITATRIQVVEIEVTAYDDEWAWEHAIDAPQSDWDVVETKDVEECVSVIDVTPDPTECY